MQKKANVEPMLTVLIAILVGGGLLLYANNQGWLGSIGGGGGGGGAGVDWASTCGDDLQSTVALDMFNGLNESGAEQFSVDYYLVGSDGDYESGEDTIAGSETLNCGEEYTLYAIATDADEGNNSKIDRVMLGPGASIVNGAIKFTPNKDQYSLKFAGSQHGVLEFKVYDNDAAAFQYDSGDATNNVYEGDGTTFTSTTDNATASAIGAGGYQDLSFSVRATRTDTSFGEDYWLILVEAPVATWDEPIVKVDGVRASDVKGSLSTDEEKQFAAYEYIYKVTGKPIDYAGVDVDFRLEALAGVDPSVDTQVDFAAAGNFLSVDGVTIKNGAAKDDSSSTVVFTVQDMTFDIS